MLEKLKPHARYLFDGLKALLGGSRERNWFRYTTSLTKTEHINFVPPVLGVTVNSTCNLRCPNCFYVIRGKEDAFKGGAMIKVEDFQAVMDRYGDKIQSVWFTGGEVLAHPKLDKLVDIVKGRNKAISLKTSTNGVFIERKIDILKSFDHINVSLDAYDYKTFEKYRGGTPREFDQIVHGLSLLRERNIFFSTSFVLSVENIHEINPMLEFGRQAGPRIVILHSINPHGCKEFTPLTRDNEKVQKMLAEICGRDDYPFDIHLPVIFDTRSKGFLESKCHQQWLYACFNDKGHVSYCCHMDHDESIGNMFNGYDFNSEKMRGFRRRMINHEYPKDECLFCHRRFMGQEYGYFDARARRWIFQGTAGSGSRIDFPVSEFAPL